MVSKFPFDPSKIGLPPLIGAPWERKEGPSRFRIVTLNRGKKLVDTRVNNLQEVKAYVAQIKRNNPGFIKLNDINVTDEKNGTEYTVDQNYKLTEM